MNLDFTSNLSASKVVPLLGGLSVLGLGAALLVKRSVEKMYEKSELEKECEVVHEIPGKIPVLGHYVHIAEKGDFNLNYFKDETAVHPTIQFSLPFAPIIYWTSDPAVIKRILLTGFKEGIYEKAQYSINQFKEFLGEGIFLSNGEQWKNKRKLASHLFHHRNLHKYISIFAKNSMNLVRILDRTRKANSVEYQKHGIDLQDYFMRYTLDSFCEIGFGVNINSLSSTESALKFQKAFDYVQTFSENRGRSGELWRIKEFFFKNAEFEEQLSYLNEFVNSIIEQRKEETREELEGRTDLLSQLLLQNLQHIEDGNENECFSPVELRDWIMNFLIAGRDTTAILLTWCSYLLSLKENDQYYQRVIDEINSIYNIDENLPILNEIISFETQKQQKEMKKVLQETLRLYPPVPVDGYASIKDDVIKTSSGEKIFVKKGTFILYSAWTTHRQEYNFPNAESFNPDRFDGPIIPYSFVPFHGGPRVCLGQDMAYIEAKILMTCLLSHFKLDLVGSVVPKQALILTAKNGAHFHISPRSNITTDHV